MYQILPETLPKLSSRQFSGEEEILDKTVHLRPQAFIPTFVPPEDGSIARSNHPSSRCAIGAVCCYLWHSYVKDGAKSYFCAIF